MSSRYMYFKRILRKRAVDLVLVGLVTMAILLPNLNWGGGKGTFLYDEGRWYVDLDHSYDLNYHDIIISNPELFSHILIPQSEGKEFIFVYEFPDILYAILAPLNGKFIYVELYDTFKMNLLGFYSVLSFLLPLIIFLIYVCIDQIYINRKNFQIINKLIN